MASVQPEISWPNYTTFINAVARVDPGFEWLDRFLSQHQQRWSSEGQLNILESYGDTIKDNACSLDGLNLPPKAGSTRIVVLSYGEAWSLNRELLDKVALALDLSPYFLWQHLEYQGHHSESAFPDPLGGSYYVRPPAVASETLSLEIGWTPYFHMSAMIASSKTSSTGSVVMVFVRNLGFKLDLSPSSQVSGPASTKPEELFTFQQPEEFWRSLSSMSPSAIKAANNSPHDFFCPWIAGIRRLIAKELMESERALGPFAQTNHFDEESLEKITSDIELNDSILRANITNLKNYLTVHLTARTPAMLTALRDLESLQSIFEGHQKRASVLMNRLVSILALKESRKSIEQSTSTKRLTQLAYIFLPLSLSTSAFGMNTVELQNTQLWVFFATAGVSLLMSLILWLMFSWVLNPDNKNNLVGIGKAAIILLKFSWVAPSHGMTLILFALCHSTIKTRLVLIQLGVWERIWNGETPKRTGLNLPRLLSGETGWARFWFRKISEVESFTAMPRWYEKRFWQKKTSDTLP